jgi:hypothetical protein
LKLKSYCKLTRYGCAFAHGHFNSLKPTIALIIFKQFVRTLKRMQPITITKISWLKLFKEMIAVYSENNINLTNKLCELNAKLLITKQVVHIVTITF